MKLPQLLLLLNSLYVEHATTYTPGKGAVAIKREIKWEPYQLIEVPSISKWEVDWDIVENLSELNFKLFLTALYVKQQKTVYWNHRVNRSTPIPLYIPSDSLGYFIPDLSVESYKSVKHFRTVRLNQKMKKGMKVYLIHPLRPQLANKNPYWKSIKWIKQELKR